MKPAALLSLLVLPFFCAAQYTLQNLNVDYLNDANKLKQYTYENLRLYPVYAKQGFRDRFKNVGNYLPLQQAIQEKKVRVTEVSSSGSVPNLYVENLGKDTIIIICGDVVKGGKQDRIIETDIVLAPRSGKKTVNVFCVESGRWQSDRGTAMLNQARITERRETNTGSRDRDRDGMSFQMSTAAAVSAAPEFDGHYNKGSMGLRKTVSKSKDQTRVWAKVDSINTANSTLTDTKTYTALTNSSSYKTKLNLYLSFFRNKFVKDSNVIGVIVVSGNKVIGSDLFATPQLFKTQYESLLHGYITEALTDGKKVTITPAAVQAYVNGFLKDETSQKKFVKEKGSEFVDKGRKLRVTGFE